MTVTNYYTNDIPSDYGWRKHSPYPVIKQPVVRPSEYNRCECACRRSMQPDPYPNCPCGKKS